MRKLIKRLTIAIYNNTKYGIIILFWKKQPQKIVFLQKIHILEVDFIFLFST